MKPRTKSILVYAIMAIYFFASFFGVLFAHNLDAGAKKMESIVAKMVPADELSFAKTTINKVKNGDNEFIESVLINSETDKSQWAEAIQSLRMNTPSDSPITLKLLSYNVHSTPEEKIINIGFQAEYKDGFRYYNTAFKKLGEGFSPYGFHVNYEKESLAEKFRFSFLRFDMSDALAFLIALAISAFVLWTFYRCAYSNNLKYKKIFMVLILVGAGRVHYNFTDNSILWFSQLPGSISLDFAQVPVSSFTQMYLAPPFFNYTIPIWAILFWILYFRRPKAEAIENIETSA